jgi:peptidyl-prolyl cis-trans isomerase SurA
MSLTLNATRFVLDKRTVCRFAVANVLVLASALQAQVVKAPRYGQQPIETPTQQLVLPPLPAAITPHGTVVEDIVVRVNDQIISRSDVERQEEQLLQAAAQNNASKDDIANEQKNMLRDMIDQQLLLSRAKELGLNADADVIRRLDDIRRQNKMDSMDELERAARKEGVNFEDFKAQIRNQILTQMVVRDEVGRRLQVSQGDLTKYYNEHKDEFVQPEQIHLSEILIPTADNASAADISQAEAKANDVKAQLDKGADFAELAKKYSGGPSAAQGGELGLFKRGELAKVLEDQTFGLKVGDTTSPTRTRQGFVILKVTEHVQPGPSPMKDVQPQIEEALYMQAMQPALRTYLSKLRVDSYVNVESGFVDSGANPAETQLQMTAYAPPAPKKKVQKQKARFDRTAYTNAAKNKPVISSPDTTGGRTLTGADAQTQGVDPATGLAKVTAPPAPGTKGKHVKKEKIRFGQAPRNSLAAGPADASTVAAEPAPGAPAAGERGAAAAPGAVMASNGAETANLQDNPLTPAAPERKKTRFAATEKAAKEKKATTVTAKQQEKVIAKPVAMTADEKATAQTQAAPLGLNGDTTKKPKKPKKVKGQPKERLQDKPTAPKPVAPAPDPTVNPALAPTSIAPAAPPATPPPATPPQL